MSYLIDLTNEDITQKIHSKLSSLKDEQVQHDVLHAIHREKKTLRSLQHNLVSGLFNSCSSPCDDAGAVTTRSQTNLNKIPTGTVLYRMAATLYSNHTQTEAPVECGLADDAVSQTLHNLTPCASANHVISMSTYTPETERVAQQLRLLCSDAGLWGHTQGPDHAATARLHRLLANTVTSPDFTQGWQYTDSQTRTVTPVSNKRPQRGSVLCKSVSSKGCVTSFFLAEATPQVSDSLADTDTHHMQRCIAEVHEVARHFHMVPKQLVVHVSDNVLGNVISMHVITTPTSQTHQNHVNLQRNINPALLPSTTHSRNNRMLCMCSIGILNDHVKEHPVSTFKKMSLSEVEWKPHKRFGVHDIAFAKLVTPQLHDYARWIGEIHFMTQIGKGLLKLRQNPSNDVVAVTADQHGVHLKDEAKLCKYFETVSGLLSNAEQKCMQQAIARMHMDTSLLTLTLRNSFMTQTSVPVSAPAVGASAGSASDAEASRSRYSRPGRRSDSNKDVDPNAKVQSLHHMRALVNIKGSMNVPVQALQCGFANIPVRIDNDWPIEANLVAYE